MPRGQKGHPDGPARRARTPDPTRGRSGNPGRRSEGRRLDPGLGFGGRRAAPAWPQSAQGRLAPRPRRNRDRTGGPGRLREPLEPGSGLSFGGQKMEPRQEPVPVWQGLAREQAPGSRVRPVGCAIFPRELSWGRGQQDWLCWSPRRSGPSHPPSGSDRVTPERGRQGARH